LFCRDSQKSSSAIELGAFKKRSTSVDSAPPTISVSEPDLLAHDRATTCSGDKPSASKHFKLPGKRRSVKPNTNSNHNNGNVLSLRNHALSVSDSNLSRHKPPQATKPSIPKSMSKEDVKTVEVTPEEATVSLLCVHTCVHACVQCVYKCEKPINHYSFRVRKMRALWQMLIRPRKD